VASDRNLIDVRFPVQYVIRPQTKEHHDYRGYAGQVAGGVLKPGDTVTVLPSGFTTTIEAIDALDGPVVEAYAPMSVVVRLADNLDVSRGDMICRPKNMPTVTQDIDGMVAWMINEPLRVGAKLVIKHTTRSARALVKDVQYRLDVNTLHRDETTGELGLNDIGRVRLRTTVPLFVDDYRNNRTTGGFILIDEATNVTVGAGMITDTH
jgi:bifunctional enzyme CysN/CysC